MSILIPCNTRGDDYVIFIPYDDEEETVTEVVIFKIKKDDEEDCLEQIDDPDVIADVYELFKDRNADLFEFED